MLTITCGYLSKREMALLRRALLYEIDDAGRKLSKTMVAIYMRIVECCGGKDHSHIGWGRMADDLNVHPRTVERLRAKLIRTGLIAIEKGVTWLLDHPVVTRWREKKKPWKNEPSGTETTRQNTGNLPDGLYINKKIKTI